MFIIGGERDFAGMQNDFLGWEGLNTSFNNFLILCALS